MINSLSSNWAFSKVSLEVPSFLWTFLSGKKYQTRNWCIPICKSISNLISCHSQLISLQLGKQAFVTERARGLENSAPRSHFFRCWSKCGCMTLALLKNAVRFTFATVGELERRPAELSQPAQPERLMIFNSQISCSSVIPFKVSRKRENLKVLATRWILWNRWIIGNLN